MGSRTWEKVVRELRPVSPTVAVVCREASPKRGTWAGRVRLALEPVASWSWSHTRKPCQPSQARIRLEKAVMEQIGCS